MQISKITRGGTDRGVYLVIVWGEAGEPRENPHVHTLTPGIDPGP